MPATLALPDRLDELQVELRSVDSLIPAARNPRTHAPAQIRQLARSIAEFGWTNPILLDADGVIVAGHGRLLAARELGMREVPVIALTRLTPEQRRAYLLADNQLALCAGWDEELLALELGELQTLGVDLELTGFSRDELDAWLGLPVQQGQTDDDAVPEVPAVPVTRPGDIWRLGEHRLLCGDSTLAADLDRLLDGDRVAMVFTDPPYNVDYGNTAKDKLRGKDRRIRNDNLGTGFAAFLEAACRNLLRVCDGAVYVCMASSELHTLQATFAAAGGHWSTFVIWAKNTFTLGRSDYQRQYEPILYGWPHGARRHWCGARDQGDVWAFDKPVRNDLHPTMKPVGLVERAIRNSSQLGDLVLDGFGGAGSTLIASARCGRRARLIELDPGYCDVICRRWQDWSGEVARRHGDGMAFTELNGADP